MSEWWTYSLSDFLLFSPRTYYRLLDLYNVAIWPLQILAIVAGIAVVVSLARKPEGNRIAPVLLALAWTWVAWAFHVERYAQINWAATAFAIAFGLEAALLLGCGVVAGGVSLRLHNAQASRSALLLALAIVVAYPVLAPLHGQTWTAGETFGIAPDPTALATLALLVQVRGTARWMLAAIPLAWCILGALTLLALGSLQAYAVAALTLVALALGIATPRAALRSR